MMKRKTDYKKISINLPEKYLVELEKIREDMHYPNITEVIRHAVLVLIKRHKIKRHRKFMIA